MTATQISGDATDEWGRLALAFPDDRLERQVARHARTMPDEIAVIHGDIHLSWDAVDRLADGLAGWFAAQGLNKGDHVGWLARNSAAFPVLLVAARRRGLVLVGFNWRLSVHELAQTVQIGTPKLVVTDAEFAAGLPAGVATLDAGAPFMEAARNGQPVENVEVEGNDDCTIFFTSGSSGFPKGVVCSLESTERSIYGVQTMQLAPEARLLIVAPMFHSAGWAWSSYALAGGMTQIISVSAFPADMLDAVSQHGATHAQWVPTMLHLAVAEQDARPRDLSTLRLIAYGSAPIAPSLLQRAIRLFGCQFSQVYGMTEAVGAVGHLSAAAHHRDWGSALAPTVQINPDVDYKIVDPEGNAAPSGSPGELVVRLPYPPPRYVGNIPLADGDGWIETGDMGWVDADAYLRLVGRQGDLIISGGENVYPAEVENVIAEIDGVDQVAVFGDEDEKWGQRVCAAIVPRNNAILTDEDIVAACRGRIASYKIPRQIAFVDALPRNATGKVIRGALPQLLSGISPN